MTSPAHVADLKGKSFGHTIYPLSFVVIALTFLELRRRGEFAPEDQEKESSVTPLTRDRVITTNLLSLFVSLIFNLFFQVIF